MVRGLFVCEEFNPRMLIRAASECATLALI